MPEHKQIKLRVPSYKPSKTRMLKFTGYYEYSIDRTLKEVMEFLIGCGIHNIQIEDEEA